MNKDSKIFIAGSNGMVGSGILRLLKEENFTNILSPNSRQLNLLNQLEVEKFFKENNPEYIFNSAAKVGGIYANDKFSADFIYENLQIQNNLIHFSMKNGVKKFLFLGSSCIYPRECKQPIKEEYLLTDTLEETNEAYAIAKISGIKMLEHYRKCYDMASTSLMPCNLYGNNDNYDLNTCHVFPALIKRFVDAKINNAPFVEVWGSGKAFREFMHVNDIARASIYFMKNDTSDNLVNIGWGKEISILDLVGLIKKSTNYRGDILWDTSKKEGTINKKLDIEKMKMNGFQPVICLEDGINLTIESYCQENYNKSFQSLIND